MPIPKSRLVAAILAALAIYLTAAAPAAAQLFETKADTAFILDADTGTVLLSKDPDRLIPPASLAKLMTMEVAFNAIREGRLKLSDTFYISEHAWRTGGAPSGTSTMFAEVGSDVPLQALLKGAMVHSANDACIAIAEGMAGTEENFALLMTERARQLGLQKSVFKNATGLPADGQLVTARELALLAQHIWRNYPEFYAYFSIPEFTWNDIKQRNRNPLLSMNIGADGLKTGYTQEAGYGIVGSVERDGRRVFAALSGMSSPAQRAEEARKALEWSLRAFEAIELFAEGEIVGEATTFGGERASVGLVAKGPVTILVPLTNRDKMIARIVYRGPVAAPFEAGREIGSLRIWIGDTLSQETPLYTAEAVEQGPLHWRALDAIKELAIGWIRQVSWLG